MKVDAQKYYILEMIHFSIKVNKDYKNFVRLLEINDKALLKLIFANECYKQPVIGQTPLPNYYADYDSSAITGNYVCDIASFHN